MDVDTSSSTLDLFEMHEHGDSCRPLAVLFECMYDCCLRTWCGARYLDAFCVLQAEVGNQRYSCNVNKRGDSRGCT